MKKNKGMVVALTGNISSGKSTVLSLFEKLGCKIVSMDDISHELLFKPQVKKEILKAFGSEVTNLQGMISRSRLAKVVFGDKARLKKLEQILHPEIVSAVTKEMEAIPAGKILIVEAPLLFETGWDKNVDHTILVTCNETERKRRYYASKKREPGEFEMRNKEQWSEEKKMGLATFTIENSKDLTKTISLVTSVLKKLQLLVNK